MGTQFKSKKIDLTLELTTLAGEECVIKGPTNISAKYAGAMMKKWAAYENKDDNKKDSSANKNKNNTDDDTPVDEVIKIAETIATELSFVYTDTEPEWFLSNFDMGTLNDILKWVAEELTGLKKIVTN